jgi:pentapeptide MXKDX repeat protein
MTTRIRPTLAISTVMLSLSLALAPAAFAQDKMGDKMGKDDGMKKDTMSKDSMKKDTMSKDTMSKDTMSKDSMKKDDGMMKKGN